MTTSLIVLVPVLVLVVVTLLAFAGCTPFRAGEAVKEKDPPAPPGVPPVVPPVVPPDPPVTTSKTYSQTVREHPNLRAYWRLGSPDTTVAMDSKAQAHPGAYKPDTRSAATGVLTFGKEQDDGAAAFNGTTAYVEVIHDSLLNPPQSFSVEAWVRPELTDASTRGVVASNQFGPDHGYTLSVRRDGAGTLFARARVGTGADFEPLEVPLGDGSAHDGWRHVVMTYDRPATTLTLYVLAGTSERSDTLNNVTYVAQTTRALRIGAARDPGGNDPVADFFPGRIDEVAVYGDVLSVETIRDHFKVATTK